FLERAKHAEVIGVAAVERTVAANHNGINGANFRRQRVAVLQILENCLLVWMSDAESANSKLGNSGQKIAELMYKEREINGIHTARHESPVVEQRRKGMADGIANHSVDPCAARESVRAVE